MFGYIIPYKSELKVREYDLFKAYYCGLCKTLGREFNQVVRLGLNYDLTFLALLLSSIDDNKETITREACIANPVKKKYIINANRAILYASNMSIILTYYKLMDDWKDEKSIKSLIATIPYVSPLSKTNKIFGRKADSIKAYLDKFTLLEKNKCNKVDEIADVFGKLMEEISVPDYIEDIKAERTLKWIGYNLGRWIYILDAFDDLESDIKNNSFNPILLQYKYSNIEGVHKFVKRIKETIEFSLIMSLESISKGVEILDIRKNRGIIENIVYMGSRHRMDVILNKGGCFHEESI